ncbi:helix-turn-helix domain-containing protein [Bhargavaea ullalensis]|uniref:Transcriptional regulator with XRE-family HTH domain n=1 Tax=Bhargavaea ullalensis TaxID=1265685 RepID=A0ABV2GCL7_9BACL
MPTLGERIRSIRKERKLTLDNIAGERMSKGMLSLIENNKAKPSMESLSYIAERLGVSPSELLEEVSAHELREVLEKAEELAKVKVYDQKKAESQQRIVDLLSPYAERLGDSYESARILQLYAYALHFLELEGWEGALERAAAIYDSLNITARRADIGMFRAQMLYTRHRYADSLAVLLSERRALESRGTFIEPMTKLDFDYLEAALHYAVGQDEEALRVMDAALVFSREKGLYYRMSDWYRLAAIHALMTGNRENYAHYRLKLEQYSTFAEDEETGGFLKFLDIHELTSYDHQYAEALELVREVEQKVTEEGGDPENLLHSPYLKMEAGKALSGLGRHEEAIGQLRQVQVPREFIHHPIDLSIFFEGEAFLAESLEASGKSEEAEEVIRRAHEQISPLIETPYKKRIRQVYDRMTGGN